MTAIKMTSTFDIATALNGEHRSIKNRAETILANLEETGVVTKEPHLSGSRWVLSEDNHAAFPSGVVAEHGFFLSGSKARYETLLLCPTVCLMLSASVRKDGRMAKVIKLTGQV